MNTTAQNYKQAIKKSARNIVNEPLEMLKSASDQITGSEDFSDNYQEDEIPTNGPAIEEEEKYKKQVVEQDGRHLEALESEIKDIRRQKLFNDLMQKIQSGVAVSIEEFSELSYEQRDVLKAQVEAFKHQQEISASQNSSLNEPSSKKGRKMGNFGQKEAAEKQTTRVEKPIPPSG